MSRKDSMMDEHVARALARDLEIDITTLGRRSGRARRVEIWFHRFEERFFITGVPGRRAWYANLLAHPRFTFHLKQSVKADLAAVARPVTEPAERQKILLGARSIWSRPDERSVDRWVKASPLVEVIFDRQG